jgi:hypothetical protein
MAPWGDEATLGSGLPDRFQFTVSNSRAKYPYEKNPTQVAIVIEGEQNIDGEIEDNHLWLKPGTAFETGDEEGTFLVHQEQTPDVYDGGGPKPKKINKNSAYGKFLASAISVIGIDELAAHQEATHPEQSKYQIWDVTFWEGLVLDIEVVDEPFDFTDDEGKEVKGVSRQPYVRALLGKADVSTATGAATPTPEAQNTAPTQNGKPAPGDYPNALAYIEAVQKAGGDVSDVAALQAEWTAAQA